MSSIRDYYRDRYAHLNIGPGPESELIFQLRVEAAFQALVSSPRRILDFGCNVGTAAAIFTEAGHNVVSLDISQSAIRLAQAKVPKARFDLIQL